MAEAPTMLAATHAEYSDSPSDAVTISTIARPVIQNKETSNCILVKVHAAAINPFDYKVVEGNLSLVVTCVFPRVIGSDFSGEVVEVGGAVTRFQVGDAVFGCTGGEDVEDSEQRGRGTFAEYCICPETHCAKKPSNVSYTDAASIPMTYITSYQALVTKAELQQGEKVLILGGASATGIAGIQIARMLGASEIVVTSSSADLVNQFGATRVINYREGQNWWEVLKGDDFDVLYDTVGDGRAFPFGRQVLKKTGRLVSLGWDSPGGVTVGNLIRLGGRTVASGFWGMFGYGGFMSLIMSLGENVDDVAKMVENGNVQPFLDGDGPYALATDIKTVIEKCMSGRVKGKIVVTMVDPAD